MNERSTASSISASIAIMALLAACSTEIAPVADASRDDESAARISAGMSRLGASDDRSDCYADKIASALSGAEASEAVKIVEASTSKEEMRSSVLGASTSVKQSFIRAHFGCSLFQ